MRNARKRPFSIQAVGNQSLTRLWKGKIGHLWLGLILLWIMTGLGLSFTVAEDPLVLTLVDVNGSSRIGDALLIQTHNQNILVDAGLREAAQQRLLPLLKAKGIDRIDKAFLTHFHPDHYQGFFLLLKHGIKIKEFYFNPPLPQLCNQRTECDLKLAMALIKKSKDNGARVMNVTQGQQWKLGRETRLKVVFDGHLPSLAGASLNDSSMVLKLEHGDLSILLTGDLDSKAASLILEQGYDIKADILKLPHHGVQGLPPKAFFEQVGFSWAVGFSPKALWCSRHTDWTRAMLREKRVQARITGLEGNIELRLTHQGVRIEAERKQPLVCPKE